MVISHERYFDESSRFHVSLELVSRTNAMHGLLSTLDDEARRRVSDALVEALDAIGREIAPAIAASPMSAGTTSFGCGT
jgi:hypothetical protein